MKLSFTYIAALVLAFSLTGCVDDEPLVDQDFGVESESPLQFLVRSYDNEDTRKSDPSATPEPETPDERKIENFWLFQFNTDGTQLAAPKYYTVSEGQLNTVTKAIFTNDLVKKTEMTIYVVTNVGEAFPAATYNTLQKVKEAALPSPYPIRVISDATRNDKLLIPMSGQVDNVTATDKSLIIVPVTRMYAKVKIRASFPYDEMDIYDVTVYNIPWYCRVAPDYTLDENGEAPVTPVSLPTGTTMINRGFVSTDALDGWITLYVPENLQGEQEGVNKQFIYNPEQKYGPADALNVYVRSKYDGMDYDFYVYPGENEVNNFNVRRNCVYRVVVDVKNARDQHKPSSNCYVVKPNSKVTFEPYYRIEKGGGYNIADYLSPFVDDKKIVTTEIIWQTKDCIGDNKDGSKVKFTLNEEDPIHSKLTVYTGAEGNALVGAKNAKGEIVWSWHIWVTENRPDNFGDAIVFKTYQWDESGIKNTAPRIPGFGVMPCNLGALAYTPKDPASVDFDTYGMMYQWGRKDPFPPFRETTGNTYADGWLDYTNDNAGTHYGNDNSNPVDKTSGTTESYLFHTILKSSITQKTKVRYSIANPTVYIAATRTLNNPSGLNPQNTNYEDFGNWCPDERNNGEMLWGGLEPNESMKCFTIKETVSVGFPPFTQEKVVEAHLYDNYGTEKSIFDPCPTGWRVAPPDLWLGFTKTGLNPKDFGSSPMNQVNYDPNASSEYGLSMFMREWHDGPTSYFPTQGTLGVNGRGYHIGVCGNYHNATCSDERVNILHIHDDSDYQSFFGYYGAHFHIFELEYINYYVKSTAGPVRCVRDHK